MISRRRWGADAKVIFFFLKKKKNIKKIQPASFRFENLSIRGGGRGGKEGSIQPRRAEDRPLFAAPAEARDEHKAMDRVAIPTGLPVPIYIHRIRMSLMLVARPSLLYIAVYLGHDGRMHPAPANPKLKSLATWAKGKFLSLIGNTESGVLPVEDGQIVLQEHVAEDLYVFARIALNAAKALAAANLGVGQLAAIDRCHEIADGDGEVREGLGTVVDVPSLCLGYLCAGDFGVIGLSDILVHEQKGSARVGDGWAARRALGGGATDAVAVRGELPEAVAVVHIGVVDLAGVLGGIDFTECV